MKKFILIALLILCIAIPVEAADGVINVPSAFNVKETADRMERVLKLRKAGTRKKDSIFGM